MQGLFGQQSASCRIWILPHRVIANPLLTGYDEGLAALWRVKIDRGDALIRRAESPKWKNPERER
jgi:hypothetical protein